MTRARGLVALIAVACGADVTNDADATNGAGPTSHDDAGVSVGDDGSASTSSGSSSTTDDLPSAYEVDGGGEGCAFACPDPPADSGFNVNVECDVWAQDCPIGLKCMPWANDGGTAWNATRCSPLDPAPRDPGDSCTVEGSGVSGIDDCGIATMCWNVDAATNVGTCVAFCHGAPGLGVCEDPELVCLVAGEGSLILCVPPCDPLAPDCPAQQVCRVAQDGYACGPEPGPTGDAPPEVAR